MNLSSRQACGWYDVKIKLLKESTHIISGILVQLINKSFLECNFPNLPKYTEIRPVHKQNVKAGDILNYKSISLLGKISKII